MENRYLDETTYAWRLYDQGKDYLHARSFYSKIDKNHRFYEGDQWGDNPPKDMPMPVMNIIKRVVDYKVAVVAQNGMDINFDNNDYSDEGLSEVISVMCRALNQNARKIWETTSMDAKLWDILAESAIAGGAGIYSYYDIDDDTIKTEVKDNSEIIFGDEQQTDIERQPFILLPYRAMTCDVKREAEKNGVNKEETDKISSDTETAEREGASAKYEKTYDEGGGKCMVVLHLYKKDDGQVYMTKSTRYCEIVKETCTKLTRYPVAFMSWQDVKGTARGKGEVETLIPNQVEINKNYARRAVSIMMTAYPKLAYLKDKIEDISSILKVGTAIAINGAGSATESVKSCVGYLDPAPQGSDAANFCGEMRVQTLELSGASDAALGNVNPEQTSGRAILAVRDASAVPLNRQVNKCKKFVEDIARIWWDILMSNNKESFKITYNMPGDNGEDGRGITETIPKELLDKSKLSIRVDVSPANTYSKYAVEQSLENLLTSQLITFEEYIESLPSGSVMPKGKLQKIVSDRSRQEDSEKDKLLESLMSENESLKQSMAQAQTIGQQIIQKGQKAQNQTNTSALKRANK